jgi:hypothetical protein
MREPTTKNDCAEQNGCISCSLDDGDDCCRKLYEENMREPTTKNDCEHCAKTYGTLGCCDYVNNEPVYSCKEGHEEYARGIRKFGSTIKNDSAVDCIVDILGSYTDLDIPYKREIAENILDNLSSVTPQESRWIPVSEKLPNDRDWYLGIFKEPDTGWINPLPFISDYVGRETKATTKEHWILRGFTDRDVRDCDYYFNLECVAWMPLPKPYREVEE